MIQNSPSVATPTICVTCVHIVTSILYLTTAVQMMRVSTFCLLLWSLVEVHSQQTFPYVSFKGPALADHSYVDLSTVGGADDTVMCHTDLSTCCSASQGFHRGKWSFPDGTILPFFGSNVPIALGRTAQIAVIRRTGGATEPTGIYCCRIATNAVHSDTDRSVGETVYVGLYPADGMLNLILSLFIKLYIHRWRYHNIRRSDI